jgi:hypothetical protein
MPTPKPERRSRQRVPARVPVTLKSKEGTLQTTGYTRDLSTTGIFLYTDSQIGEGSELEIVLILPPELTQGEKRWVCCQGSVVRVESAGDGGNFGVAANLRTMEIMPEIAG